MHLDLLNYIIGNKAGVNLMKRLSRRPQIHFRTYGRTKTTVAIYVETRKESQRPNGFIEVRLFHPEKHALNISPPPVINK